MFSFLSVITYHRMDPLTPPTEISSVRIAQSIHIVAASPMYCLSSWDVVFLLVLYCNFNKMSGERDPRLVVVVDDAFFLMLQSDTQ